MPSVTALITTYNRAADLARALDSVLDQSVPVTEVIVVIDGSTDDTRLLLEDYATRVTTLYQENAGQSAALNNGLQKSSAEYVAILDDDDAWAPDKIEKQLSVLDAAPDVDVVFSTMRIGGSTNEEIWPSVVPETARSENLQLDFPAFICGQQIYRSLIHDNFIPHSSVMFRKSAVEQVGNYSHAGSAKDYDLWLRLAMEGYSFSFVDLPLLEYNVHDSNMSKDERKLLEGMIEIFRKNSISLEDDHPDFSYVRKHTAHLFSKGADLELIDGNSKRAHSLYRESLQLKHSNRALLGVCLSRMGTPGKMLAKALRKDQ